MPVEDWPVENDHLPLADLVQGLQRLRASLERKGATGLSRQSVALLAQLWRDNRAVTLADIPEHLLCATIKVVRLNPHGDRDTQEELKHLCQFITQQRSRVLCRWLRHELRSIVLHTLLLCSNVTQLCGSEVASAVVAMMQQHSDVFVKLARPIKGDRDNTGDVVRSSTLALCVLLLQCSNLTTQHRLLSITALFRTVLRHLPNDSPCTGLVILQAIWSAEQHKRAHQQQPDIGMWSDHTIQALIALATRTFTATEQHSDAQQQLSVLASTLLQELFQNPVYALLPEVTIDGVTPHTGWHRSIRLLAPLLDDLHMMKWNLLAAIIEKVPILAATMLQQHDFRVSHGPEPCLQWFVAMQQLVSLCQALRPTLHILTMSAALQVAQGDAHSTACKQILAAVVPTCVANKGWWTRCLLHRSILVQGIGLQLLTVVLTSWQHVQDVMVELDGMVYGLLHDFLAGAIWRVLPEWQTLISSASAARSGQHKGCKLCAIYGVQAMTAWLTNHSTVHRSIRLPRLCMQVVQVEDVDVLYSGIILASRCIPATRSGHYAISQQLLADRGFVNTIRLCSQVKCSALQDASAALARQVCASIGLWRWTIDGQQAWARVKFSNRPQKPVSSYVCEYIRSQSRVDVNVDALFHATEVVTATMYRNGLL